MGVHSTRPELGTPSLASCLPDHGYSIVADMEQEKDAMNVLESCREAALLICDHEKLLHDDGFLKEGKILFVHTGY